MPARTWDDDFRRDAIEASLKALPDRDRDDPFASDLSFCVPAQRRLNAGLSPGLIGLAFLVAGFAAMGLGAWIALGADEKNPEWGKLILAATCTLTGFACFLIPTKGDRLIYRWLLGDRLRDTMARVPNAEMITAELGPPGDEQEIAINSDDYVAALFDTEGGRLLIEGTNARYQIRRDDVVSIRSFVFMNYLGAEIVAHVGSDDDFAELGIAIARVSLLYEITRQIPLLFFLRRRIGNPVLERAWATLGDPDQTFVDRDEPLVDRLNPPPRR